MSIAIWKLFADFEKEEAWLNEKAAQGLAFTHYSFLRYTFEPCEPGEYTYRVQYMEKGRWHPDSVNFLQFVEDSGVEVVSRYVNWVFLRKKTAERPFDLFSDIDSVLGHYRRVSRVWLAIGISQLCIGAAQIHPTVLALQQGESWGLSAIAGAICLACGCLFLVLWVRYHRKSTMLRKERVLYE